MVRKIARPSDKAQERIVVLLLFALILGVYMSKVHTTTLTDTALTVHTSLSIVKEGNIDLDEYSYAEGLEFKGHRYGYYPYGMSLLITPAVLVVDQVMLRLQSLDLYEHLKATEDWPLVEVISQAIASLLTAITALVIYAMGRLTLTIPRSLALALIFAFCTSAWSTASRDLWSHTGSMLMLSLALYLILLAKDKPKLVQFAALPLAFAYVIRPTNSVSIVLLTGYVALSYRKYLPHFLVWAAAVAIPFVALNLSLFDTFLPFYFQPQRLTTNAQFGEALIGNLVSPSRGLLIYAPVFLFVAYGVLLKIRQKTFERLDGFLLAIIVLHWMSISYFSRTWAGAAFGPRLFVDMLPYLTYFLIPVLAQLKAPKTAGQWGIATVFTILVLASLFVNYRGGTQRATWEWSMAFLNVVDSIDDAPRRVWDWSDPQFWRGLRSARLQAKPSALCLTYRQGDDAGPAGSLLLINDGDRALHWSIEIPRRVFYEPAESRIPGLGYGEVQLAADQAGYGVGLHDVGGLTISARPENGDKSVRGSPVVIPVTLQVLEPSPNSSDPAMESPASACYVAPSDILVDGKVPARGPDQLYGLYGTGWYDREIAGATTYRWTASPGRLLIFAPAEQRVAISSAPVALHDPASSNGMGMQGTITTSLDGQVVNTMPVQVGTSFSFDFDLRPGWHTVDLQLQAGNFRPVDFDPATGDVRDLSFALEPIRISTQRASAEQ